MHIYIIWLFILRSTHVFQFLNFKFLYLWQHGSVLIYRLQTIFQMFANN
jgi:hypothetical protein